MVNDVSAELNALGFALNPAEVGIEVLSAEKMASMFSEISKEGSPELLDIARTMPIGRNHEHLLQDGGNNRLAFYDPNSRTIIFREGAGEHMSRGYLAHELAHAYQDQKWGFDAIWRPYHEKPSRELYNIINYLIEGHAELARQAYEQAYASDQRTQTQLAIGLGKVAENDCLLCSSENALDNLPYSLGLRFLAKEYLKGGWAKAERNFENLPASSEQILHPDELVGNRPKRIDLPRWSDPSRPSELLLNGPMGEAFLLAKLLTLSIPRNEAFVTASGWKGDVAHLYRSHDGQEAMMWRIAFDRELDATQLENALKSRNLGGQIIKTGPIIDWIITKSPQWQSQLKIFLSKHPVKLKSSHAEISSTKNLELRVQHDALGFFGPKRMPQIHVGPHP